MGDVRLCVQKRRNGQVVHLHSSQRLHGYYTHSDRHSDSGVAELDHGDGDGDGDGDVDTAGRNFPARTRSSF